MRLQLELFRHFFLAVGVWYFGFVSSGLHALLEKGYCKDYRGSLSHEPEGVSDAPEDNDNLNFSSRESSDFIFCRKNRG